MLDRLPGSRGAGTPAPADARRDVHLDRREQPQLQPRQASRHRSSFREGDELESTPATAEAGIDREHAEPPRHAIELTNVDRADRGHRREQLQRAWRGRLQQAHSPKCVRRCHATFRRQRTCRRVDDSAQRVHEFDVVRHGSGERGDLGHRHRAPPTSAIDCLRLMALKVCMTGPWRESALVPRNDDTTEQRHHGTTTPPPQRAAPRRR